MRIDKKYEIRQQHSNILKHNLHVYSSQSYSPLSRFFLQWLQGMPLRTEETVQFNGHSSAITDRKSATTVPWNCELKIVCRFWTMGSPMRLLMVSLKCKWNVFFLLLNSNSKSSKNQEDHHLQFLNILYMSYKGKKWVVSDQKVPKKAVEIN